MLGIKSKEGFSLVEVLAAAGILLVVIFSAAITIQRSLRMNVLVDYYSRAWNIATQEMESLKHIDYSWLCKQSSYYYVFDKDSSIVKSSSSLLSKDLYKSNYFNSLGLHGSTIVYLDKVMRTSGDPDDGFIPVTVVVCYKDPHSKVVGEDKNLNGKLDLGEDKNGNGRIDSPVTIRGVVYDI